MRRFLFTTLVVLVLGVSAVLVGAFFVNALEAMDAMGNIRRGRLAPSAARAIAYLGMAAAFLIVALGVLLVCIRYASRLPMNAKEFARHLQRTGAKK